MINSLAQEQQSRLLEFRDKWMAIGLSTEPANRPMAERGVRATYRLAGLKPPQLIVWCTSPLANGLTRTILTQKASVWASVWDSVGASVRASVWDSVGASVGGNHEASWLGFYDYFARVCGLKHLTAKLSGLWCVAQSAGWFLPHEHICWISERPCELHLAPNARGIRVLHRDGGPSWRYPDGFCGWNLHGVRVPQTVAETGAGHMDADWLRENFVKQQNTEVRREIARKVGIQSLVQRLGATSLDKRGDYELLSLDLGDGRNRPYLKMLNPSIGTWHIEGVVPECRTVEQALTWRNGTPIAPEVLT